jgi:hypothetical protein
VGEEASQHRHSDSILVLMPTGEGEDIDGSYDSPKHHKEIALENFLQLDFHLLQQVFDKDQGDHTLQHNEVEYFHIYQGD